MGQLWVNISQSQCVECANWFKAKAKTTGFKQDLIKSVSIIAKVPEVTTFHFYFN